jgi:mono/diheme cytochrome c family protein
MDRRHFLVSLVAGAGAVRTFLYFHGRGQEGFSLDVRRFFPFHLEEARNVGLAALAAVGERSDQDLVEALLDSPRWANATHESAGRILGEQIREDFTVDHTRSLEGWLLAETEVVLYALVARRLAGEPVVAVEPPPRKPMPVGHAEAGRPLYARLCVQCHQANGEGLSGLTGADLTDPAVRSKSDQELYDQIMFGTRGPSRTMPAFDGMVTAQQGANLVAYLRAIWGQ